MAHTFEPQPGEEVVVDIDYRRKSQHESLRLIVTNQAIFIPAVKFAALGQAFYLRRIPLSEATEVRVDIVRPYWAYGAAAVMIAVGFIAVWSFTEPDARMTPVGLARSIAIVVGGCLMPIAAKGRRQLTIRWSGGKFKWLPPLHVDTASKAQMNEMLDRVVKAYAAVDLGTVNDELAA